MKYSNLFCLMGFALALCTLSSAAFADGCSLSFDIYSNDPTLSRYIDAGPFWTNELGEGCNAYEKTANGMRVTVSICNDKASTNSPRVETIVAYHKDGHLLAMAEGPSKNLSLAFRNPSTGDVGTISCSLDSSRK